MANLKLWNSVDVRRKRDPEKLKKVKVFLKKVLTKAAKSDILKKLSQQWLKQLLKINLKKFKKAIDKPEIM